MFVGLLGVVLDVELVLDGEFGEFGLDMVELESFDEICSISGGGGGTERVDCANCALKNIRDNQSMLMLI